VCFTIFPSPLRFCDKNEAIDSAVDIQVRVCLLYERRYVIQCLGNLTEEKPETEKSYRLAQISQFVRPFKLSYIKGKVIPVQALRVARG
jgi:hypothetical protein